MVRRSHLHLDSGEGEEMGSLKLASVFYLTLCNMFRELSPPLWHHEVMTQKSDCLDFNTRFACDR